MARKIDSKMQNKMQKLFGTDGVRGRAGAPPMTPDVLVRLGFAAGRVLGAAHNPPQILISKDTRLSGYMAESALEAGFSAAGADVLLSGPLPTSAVSYLTQTLRLSAGVVISASHNPHTDNGVKFFGADGLKISDALEAQIEESMAAQGALSFSGNPGRARRLDAAADRYIEFCKRAFPPAKTLRGMKILADCANGAAYHVAPPVLHELGADVVPFADTPDGMNINVECGVMHPQKAARAAKQHGADAAVILDGDADRVYLADETGKIHDGDALLYLFAKHMRAAGRAPEGVAGTLMSNLALERALAETGTTFFRAEVGDRHVLRALIERGWRLGGEPSGHVILRDFHCTGDGIIAALRALAVMCETQKPLSALLAGYKPCPQRHQNIAVPNRARALAAAKKTIAAAKARLGKSGRLIVRPSGTEELIRIMAEAEDGGAAKRAVEEIAAALVASDSP